MKVKKWKCESLSCVQLFVTLWIVACQAPLYMGISRQECWSGVGHIYRYWEYSDERIMLPTLLAYRLEHRPDE